MDNMEVLLLEDIPGVGQQHDIIVVRNGFALNNLLPRRRAMVATPTVRRRYEEQIRRRAEEKAHELELARSAAGVLQEKVLILVRKANEEGKLYAAVSEKEISEALNEQLSIEVAPADITIEKAIKSVGNHTAKVKLGVQVVQVRIELKKE